MWGHYMKMKKVSLRELVADKIVYAVLLAMTYWLWARNDWKDYYTTIQYVIDVFAFFILYPVLSASKNISRKSRMRCRRQISNGAMRSA